LDKIQAKNETANRGPKTIVQTLLNYFDEKVKIDAQNEPYKLLIYKDLFSQIYRRENLPREQP